MSVTAASLETRAIRSSFGVAASHRQGPIHLRAVEPNIKTAATVVFVVVLALVRHTPIRANIISDGGPIRHGVGKAAQDIGERYLQQTWIQPWGLAVPPRLNPFLLHDSQTGLLRAAGDPERTATDQGSSRFGISLPSCPHTPYRRSRQSA